MSTAKYVVKRVLFLLLTFFIIISICCILIRLLPNIPATQFGKDEAIIKAARVRQGIIYEDGTPVPVMAQYWRFVTRTLLGGEWGLSEQMYPGRQCFDVFLEKLPNTIMVNAYSSLLAVPVGLALGIYAALKKNKWQDHVVSTGVMVMVSVPSYVYAFLIQYFLCYKWEAFPIKVLSQAEAGGFLTAAMFHSMFPAILALALPSIAGYCRYTRAELTEVLTSEYLLLARTKGLTKPQTTVRHALRNAMVPIFPSIIAEVILVLSGSLIIENIFVVPGVGPLYVQSINSLDYNFFLLLSAFYTLVGLVAGIVVDISYGIIDPRIRMGSRK